MKQHYTNTNNPINFPKSENNMNERIKELSKRAYENVIETTPSFLITKEIFEQKFAELIIEECVRACVADIADPRDTIELKCAKKIKEHFGVEQ
jgi:hypothetical protein